MGKVSSENTAPLPTDASTATNQATIIGHVDGIEALLTTIDADTSSLATNLATLAGAVAGTEMQVDIVADGAGLSTAANQTTIIGHVDGIEALLGTIDTDTSTLAGAVSGTEMQVDIVTDQPLDNTADNVGAALQTDVIMNDTTALTPKFAVINATVNGDNTIVAAVSAKKIRVLSYSIVADAAVGVAFEDGAGGSELSGQMAFAANGGISVPFSPVGHFETTANTLLNIELDAAANVRGHLCYVEV